MNARCSSMSLRSWMSVAVPTQNSIVAARGRASARRGRGASGTCRRAARKRYSTSYGSPLAQRLLAARDRGRQVVGVHDATSRRSARPPPRVIPVYSNQRWLKYVAPPSAPAVHTICGIASASCAVALLARALERGELLLVQLLRLLAQLPVLLPQLDEDGDLRAEDVRVDRLEDVVDRAGRVAAEDVRVLLRERGQEDDRDVLRALALLDQRRRARSRRARASGRRAGCRRSRRAGAPSAPPAPEVTETSRCPSGSRMASSASRFSWRSSTRRMSRARSASTLAHLAQSP